VSRRDERIFVRLGVLNNLRAGRSRAQVDQVLSLLREHPSVAHVETNNGDEVATALEQLAARGIDVLALNGGDGTLQHVLTSILANNMFQPLPLIMPLRGGRTNMSALDIGNRRNPAAAVSALLAAAHTGSLDRHIVERAVLRVEISAETNASTGAAHAPLTTVQYGMFCGVGLIPRAIALTHRVFPHGRAQGVFGSGMVLGALIMRTLFNSANGILTPDRMAIRLDDRPLVPDQFQVVMATTMHRLFLKIRPFWGNEAAPIRFTAIAAEAKRSIPQAMRILRGRPPRKIIPADSATSRNVSQVELQLECGLTVDGEIFAPQAQRVVRLSANHRLRFVCA
jgi:diacylglycerol kinase (ATP)